MKNLICCVLVLLAGCAERGVELRSRFDPAEVSFIHETGEAEISGQVVINRASQVGYASGQPVLLVPTGIHADERMEAIFGDSNTQKYSITFINPHPDYHLHQKWTLADEYGHFKFSNVADGTYYVAANVPIGWRYIGVRKRVTIIGGVSRRVIVNGL